MSLVRPPPIPSAPIRHHVPRMQAQEPSHPPSKVQPGKPPFKFATSARCSLGTGTGALATRPIGRGELLLAEQPLVIQHADQPRNSHSIFTALCIHPTVAQEAYLSLPNAFLRNNDASNVDALVGIFNTNCLPLAPVTPCPVPLLSSSPSTNPEQAHGVFLTLSKFNTSCHPNASLTWDQTRNVMSVHAIDTISPGDEITICYGQPLFAVCAERREYLMRLKGFWCMCRSCTLQGEESKASDRRRAELCRLFKAIPFLGHDAPAGLRVATQALQTLNAEGLNLYQDSFAYEAYQFCMLLRGPAMHNSIMSRASSTSESYVYTQNAKHWLEHAYQWKVTVSGRESEGAMFFAQLLAQFHDT